MSINSYRLMQIRHFPQFDFDFRTPLTTVALVIDCAEMSDNPRVRQAGEACRDSLENLTRAVSRLDPNLYAISDDPEAHLCEGAHELRKNLWLIQDAFSLISYTSQNNSDLMIQGLTEALQTALDMVDLVDPSCATSIQTSQP